MVPVLLIMFVVVVEAVHLWLARVELENALEAAALAAVKEWAETDDPGSGESWTRAARDVGVAFAAANVIGKNAVVVSTNLGDHSNPNNPNENGSCQGDLVFGAVAPVEPYLFKAGEPPSCVSDLGGRVLMDVTTNQILKDESAWGISFVASANPDFNEYVVIDRIVIDIDPNETGQLQFNLTQRSPILSTNDSPSVQGWALGENGVAQASRQHDNYGFANWVNTTGPGNPTFTPPDGAWPANPQITFSPTTGTSRFLEITFQPYYENGDMVDDGFSPGDRFRFGAGVTRNGSPADGDIIGEAGAKVTVVFKDTRTATEWSETASFVDTGYSSNQCGNQKNRLGTWSKDHLGLWHLLIHPIRSESELLARDMPCPLTAATTNNHQSLVLDLGAEGVGGMEGVRNYVVRAQRVGHPVPSLLGGFLGLSFDWFTVSAQTTAMYDCELKRPRLIRVKPENFECPPGGTP
jgi:hypothetical protein